MAKRGRHKSKGEVRIDLSADSLADEEINRAVIALINLLAARMERAPEGAQP